MPLLKKVFYNGFIKLPKYNSCGFYSGEVYIAEQRFDDKCCVRQTSIFTFQSKSDCSEVFESDDFDQVENFFKSNNIYYTLKIVGEYHIG